MDNQAAEMIQSGFNPFSDEVVPQQAQTVEGAPAVTQTETQETQVQTQQEPPAQAAAPEQQPQTFDPNEFIRERFGFNSVEEIGRAHV